MNYLRHNLHPSHSARLRQWKPLSAVTANNLNQVNRQSKNAKKNGKSKATKSSDAPTPKDSECIGSEVLDKGLELIELPATARFLLHNIDCLQREAETMSVNSNLKWMKSYGEGIFHKYPKVPSL